METYDGPAWRLISTLCGESATRNLTCDLLLERGILMDHEDVSGKPLHRFMYQDHQTSHGRHARIDITTILHNAPQLHYTRYILHTQYAPNLAEVLGARQPQSLF